MYFTWRYIFPISKQEIQLNSGANPKLKICRIWIALSTSTAHQGREDTIYRAVPSGGEAGGCCCSGCCCSSCCCCCYCCCCWWRRANPNLKVCSIWIALIVCTTLLGREDTIYRAVPSSGQAGRCCCCCCCCGSCCCYCHCCCCSCCCSSRRWSTSIGYSATFIWATKGVQNPASSTTLNVATLSSTPCSTFAGYRATA